MSLHGIIFCIMTNKASSFEKNLLDLPYFECSLTDLTDLYPTCKSAMHTVFLSKFTNAHDPCFKKVTLMSSHLGKQQSTPVGKSVSSSEEPVKRLIWGDAMLTGHFRKPCSSSLAVDVLCCRSRCKALLLLNTKMKQLSILSTKQSPYRVDKCF